MTNYDVIDMCDVGAALGALPEGAEAADVLLSALSLGGDELDQVAGTHPGLVRDIRWAEVERRSPARLSSLEHLVRDEILDWTWRTSGGARWQSLKARAVGDVYVDALAAACAAEVLPARLVDQLRAPWIATRTARPVDLGPNAQRVRAALGRLDQLDGGAWELLRRCVDVDAGTAARWAAAGEDVRWAVQLTGRRRPAAAAQLLAVRLFPSGGPTRSGSVGGVRTAVNRLVQGLVVHDLLADETTDVLQSFWRAAFGDEPA